MKGSRYNNWRSLLLAVLTVSVVSGAKFAEAATTTGSISGRVTTESGGSLVGFVKLYSTSSTQSPIKQVSTDTQGKYLIDNLDAGNYFVQTSGVHSSSTNYIDELFADIACPEGRCELAKGTFVPVNAGQATVAIDFKLRPAKAIVGAIKGTPFGASSSVALASAQAVLYDGLGTVVSRQTVDPSGKYSFNFLAEGSYYVATSNTLGFIDELHFNLPCPSGTCDVFSGERIDLLPANVTRTVNFTLRPGGLMSGLVTNGSGGAPLENAIITVYDSSGKRVTSEYTNSKGEYLISSGLKAGDYYVTAQKSGFVHQLLGFGECVQACQPLSGLAVKVAANQLTKSLNFQLYTNSASPSTIDSDKDCTPDVRDACSKDAKKITAGVCGCGIADADNNLNGVFDCLLNPELKADLEVIAKHAKQLRSTAAGQYRKQSKLRGAIASNAFTVSEIVRLSAASVKLKAGTSVDLNGASLKLKKAVDRLLNASQSNRKAGNRILRAVKALSDLIV